MKLRIIVLCLLFLSLFISTVYAATTTNTYYLLNQTKTVNGLTAYYLSTASSSSGATQNLTMTYTAIANAYYGFRIFQTNINNGSTELTAGTPIATYTYSSAGNGYQSTTYTISQSQLNIGFDAIETILYMKINGTAWVAEASFTTDRLVEKYINAVTWAFKVWSNMTQSGGNTYLTVKFGGSYIASISNVAFTDPLPQEVQAYKIGVGDFIGFLFQPWTQFLGSSFYAVLMLIFGLTIFNRQRSAESIAIFVILFGGVNSVLTMLLGLQAVYIAWGLFVLSVMGVIWRVMR